MANYQDHQKRDAIVPMTIVWAVITALMMYAGVKGFGVWLGVDVTAAFTLVFGVLLTFALLILGVWSQATDTWPLTVINVLPLALSTFVMSFSPALNQLGCIGPIDMCFDIRWWGRTTTHYGISFAILLIGYGTLYLRRDRY